MLQVQLVWLNSLSVDFPDLPSLFNTFPVGLGFVLHLNNCDLVLLEHKAGEALVEAHSSDVIVVSGRGFVFGISRLGKRAKNFFANGRSGGSIREVRGRAGV